MDKAWWGTFCFDIETVRTWAIGERLIAIKRCHKEWAIWNRETDEESQGVVQLATLPVSEFEANDVVRYMVNETNKSLIIEPSLADRAIVAKPSTPLIIPSGQESQLYVSTPLWFTVMLSNLKIPMVDVPFWRPSDSWFGPSPMSGVLCYSKNTEARVQNAGFEARPHRATTVITLRNEQEESLVVERINLPVPALRLYADSDYRLWTDDLTIVQQIDNGKPLSEVDHTQPSHSKGLTLVSESRERSMKPSFLSSIKNLIA